MGSSHWDPPHFHPLLDHDGDHDDDDHGGHDHAGGGEMLIMNTKSVDGFGDHFGVNRILLREDVVLP